MNSFHEILAYLEPRSTAELQAIANVLWNALPILDFHWKWARRFLCGFGDDRSCTWWADEDGRRIAKIRKRMRADLGLKSQPIDE